MILERYHRYCRVRPPRSADFERMAELAAQLGYPCTPQEIAKRLTGMDDTMQYCVYVAELANGEIAGWIGAYVFRSVEIDSYAEISGLVVDEEARSCGIGKLLLEAIERWALSCGCDAIGVRSKVQRRDAHRFYEKNGYEWTKTQKSFRKPLTIREANASRRPGHEVIR